MATERTRAYSLVAHDLRTAKAFDPAMQTVLDALDLRIENDDELQVLVVNLHELVLLRDGLEALVDELLVPSATPSPDRLEMADDARALGKRIVQLIDRRKADPCNGCDATRADCDRWQREQRKCCPDCTHHRCRA